jgi:hypothetical protein
MKASKKWARKRAVLTTTCLLARSGYMSGRSQTIILFLNFVVLFHMWIGMRLPTVVYVAGVEPQIVKNCRAETRKAVNF